jgi:uncharacterized membrane protein
MHRGFETLGSYFVQYFALGLVLVGLPTFLMQWSLLGEAVAAGAPSAATNFTSPVYLASWFVSVLGGYLLQATVVRSSILHFGGMEPDVGKSLANSFRYILPLIGLTLLTTFLTGLGLALFVVPGIIIYIMLSVSVPALIEERGGVLHSMKRSRELTKGSRGRIFLLILIIAILYFVIAGVFGVLLAMVAGDNVPLQALVAGVSGVITGVFAAIMIASLYFELRTVKEGATVEGLANIFA